MLLILWKFHIHSQLLLLNFFQIQAPTPAPTTSHTEMQALPYSYPFFAF